MSNLAKNVWDNISKWLLPIFTLIIGAVLGRIQGTNFWYSVAILCLLIVAFVFVILYLKTKKELEKINSSYKTEFISKFGVKWLVNHTKKNVEEMPYCTCCSPPIIPSYYISGNYFHCPNSKNNMSLTTIEGTRLKLKEAYELVKKELKF